jgi:hypothetical protein
MHYSEFRAESQITAIAWSWVGEKKVHCEVLEQDLSNERSMLERFLEAYNAAGIVTGHYLRPHDLPLLNDHCMRLGFPLLKPVLVSDTMLDLPKVNGLGKSQENLAQTFGVEAGKHHMGGHRWRSGEHARPGRPRRRAQARDRRRRAEQGAARPDQARAPGITADVATMSRRQNPKDAQAAREGRSRLDLLEPTAERQIAAALATGADKYGIRNFTSSEISARTYLAAMRRHIDAWLDGEDADAESGLHPLAHVGANVHVVLAAIDAGSLVDDRAGASD